MKNEVSDRERSPFYNLNATRVIVTTIGVILGFSGFNHGFFEFLQGNTPTDGLVIQAIGEAQRFMLYHSSQDSAMNLRGRHREACSR